MRRKNHRNAKTASSDDEYLLFFAYIGLLSKYCSVIPVVKIKLFDMSNRRIVVVIKAVLTTATCVRH